MNICTICNEEIKSGVFIGTVNNGVAHQSCYVKANPPKIRKTFNEVLNNCDDQVIVREMLNEHVDHEVKLLIVKKFNEKMQERHQLRLSR